jgi:hypothetical protein
MDNNGVFRVKSNDIFETFGGGGFYNEGYSDIHKQYKNLIDLRLD